jgi:CRISPR system Cascade subunit CasC
MTATNFVNFHVLISHSPSCLNRDDMNMQKSAVFGGKKRVRISSQSLKHAFRNCRYYRDRFSRSTRTRFLIDHAVATLKSGDESRDKGLEQAGLIVAALVEGKTKLEDIKKYKRADSGRIETQVVPFSQPEIDAIKALLQDLATAPEKDRISRGKNRLAELESELRSRMDLDVALSGRMAASDVTYGVDGALALAHALTTHTVEPQDVDWFTAVDDLTQDAGETGAGHLNTQEFSSGVFYRYASLNLKQLQVNLGLLAGMESAETRESRQRALDIAGHLFHLLATVVPSAKQQSFAAHNLADFAIVSFSDLPVSLANAFEKPVGPGRHGGFLAPSIDKLTDYWSKVHRAYGLDERTLGFAVDASETPPSLKVMDALKAVEDWIVRDGRG